MDNIAQRLKAYIEAHPFDPGESDCETVLDQLYQVYQESHESDPPDIRDGFRELDDLLGDLPLEDNNKVLEQIVSDMDANEELRTQARNNSQEHFRFPFNDAFMDVVIGRMAQKSAVLRKSPG